MNKKNGLTLNGLVLPNFIFILLCIGMIFVGSYLTNHFFHIFYPSGVAESSSLCDINQFWGCDKATRSELGTIFGVPTSLFGIIIGLIGLITGFVGKEGFERTTKIVFLINLVLCIVLFLYSLALLNSLCPMCTVYYVLSALTYFMLHKYSQLPLKLDPKATSVFFLMAIVPMIGLHFYINEKEKEVSTLASSYVIQFNNLKNYGDPANESPYKIHMSTENFSDAPIRISVFSDFQCPYCNEIAKQIPELIREFKGAINIQYLFYPLDGSCNTKMKGGMHPYACQAAYLAACDVDKFVEIHDYIFEHQNEISPKNLTQWATKFDLTAECFENADIHDQIQQTLNTGEQYNLRSTPTIIVNGKKLEGLIPTVHLKSILRSLIPKNEK
ncbi:MAG: vitamin K epoxide reductase family protein [Bacteriovoracaceae bacterium]|jgi:protein-disulfide isomerase/uncharacterized membrane protein|nr:hypothetical protein [Halobacteriovoraceae bacterium]MDP7319637.1 vitamin K epoxide reductase family protein [Bacteriovoracaceae bacterium]